MRLVTARAGAFLRQAGIAAADLAATVLPPQRDRALMAALRAVLPTGPDLITAPFVGATAGRDDLASHGLAAAWTNRPQGHGGPVLLIGPSAGLQTASALHA